MGRARHATRGAAERVELDAVLGPGGATSSVLRVWSGTRRVTGPHRWLAAITIGP